MIAIIRHKVKAPSCRPKEAVREWIDEPCLVNGIPRPVRFTVTFILEKR